MWAFLSSILATLFKSRDRKLQHIQNILKSTKHVTSLDPIKAVWTFFVDAKNLSGLCCQTSHGSMVLAPVYGKVKDEGNKVVSITTDHCVHFFYPCTPILSEVAFGEMFAMVLSDRPGLQHFYWVSNAKCSLRSCLEKHLCEIIGNTRDQDDVLKLRYSVPIPAVKSERVCYLDE